jgi:hypothetical protein
MLTEEQMLEIKALPDAEKIRLMDNLFEMAGGSVGALAGQGLMSVPAAGAGAVAGRNLLSRPLARAMGLKEPEQSVGEELESTGKTFSLGAAGEGAGKMVGAGIKALPQKVRQLPLRLMGANKATISAVPESTITTTAKNAVRKFSAQTPEAKILEGLAQKYNIPLDWGQRSGNPVIQSLGVAMKRMPGSAKKMADFNKGQFSQYQNAINGWMDQIHKSEITIDDFAALAENTLGRLRNELNTKVSTTAAATGKALSPQRVSDVEAGMGLQKGHASNLEAVSRWADGAYGRLRSQYGDAAIDITPLNARANALKEEIPDLPLKNIFPAQAMKIIDAAAAGAANPGDALLNDIAKSQTGKLFAHLDQPQQETVRKMAASMGAPVAQQAPTISFAEAMNARSTLLKRAAVVPDPAERRYMLDLADGINEAVEQSMSSTPAAGELKRVNTKYRQFMEKLRPPSPNREGNVAAEVIGSNRTLPEQLPGQMTGSPSLVEKTVQATSPSTSGATFADPIPGLRRNRFDSMVDDATITDPATGSSRISPQRFSEKLPDRSISTPLYGSQLPSVESVGSPSFVASEQRVYGSPLSKAVDAGQSADRVYGAAFPKRGFGGNVEDTMRLFEEVGARPQAERGFAEGMLTRSETQMPTIGDIRATNPRTLERNLDAYGDTTEQALGPHKVGELRAISDLGKGITHAESQLGNPSGTSRVSYAMNLIPRVLKEPGTVYGEVKGAMLGAEKFTKPPDWAFKPPQKVDYQMKSALPGIAMQGVSRLPQSSPAVQPEEDFFLPGTAKEDEEDFFVPGTARKVK